MSGMSDMSDMSGKIGLHELRAGVASSGLQPKL